MAAASYQILHPSRLRNYGHPSLLAFVRTLAGEAEQRHWGELMIGDLSLPSGGPVPSNHGSHQSGLDVDVFFGSPQAPLTPEQLENPPVEEVVLPGGAAVDPQRWNPVDTALVEAAARQPEVARIFVHPAIKRALCQSAQGDRGWLRKVRPWWGHTEHFHVRVACPADSPECRDQPAPPAGDGCGAELDWWFTPEAATPPRHEGKPPVLPQRCQKLLEGQKN